MSLNQAAIVELAEDLIANVEKYDQDLFGCKSVCGTTCCLAGLVRLRKIGIRAFNKEVIEFKKNGFSSGFGARCISDGNEKLGLPERVDIYDPEHEVIPPQIFEPSDFWPYDLYSEYSDAGNDSQRVTVALKALQRLLPDGDIDEDENAVHTDLSVQLEKIDIRDR